MNEQNADKEYLLDLLVDGELGEEERRELLAWCEREPDGWRRCALAFLEAQSWSQVLGKLSEPARQSTVENQPATETESAVRPLARPPQFWHTRQWGTMLAMAASIALAFTLGLWVREAGRVERIAPQGPSAIQFVEDKSPDRFSSGRPKHGPENQELAVGDSAPNADEIQLPVPVGDDWLLTEPSAIPADVQRALERMGHRVEQRRQLVPYRLEDGRRVVVPVDQVEVHPVGNPSYQ